jgi:hypothetical protein
MKRKEKKRKEKRERIKADVPLREKKMWLLPTKMVSHKCIELADLLLNFHWHKSSDNPKRLLNS